MTAETRTNHPGSKRPAGKVAKHTPGPWEVSEEAGYLRIRGQEYVAETCKIWERGEARLSSESMAVEVANAKLIAAAPELLNMLERVLGEVESSPLAEGNKVVSLLTREHARAAISKATK